MMPPGFRPLLAGRYGHPRHMLDPSLGSSPSSEPPAMLAAPRLWRREYTLLVLVGVLVSVLAFLFFFLDVDLEALKGLGYVGIFLISLIGSASMVLPLPGAAVVVGSSQFVDDVAGLPFWLLVGVLSAAGETLGELTGYAAGLGGSPMVEDRPLYRRFRGWMERHGIATMFALSAIPNPVFDIGGFMAGAVRMPMWRFMASVFTGKLIKNATLALGGDVGIAALVRALD